MYGTISDSQKDLIDQFLTTFDVDYCVDVNEYFDREVITTTLQTQYEARVAAGENRWYDFSSYKGEIIGYFNNSYWYSSIPLSETELDIISGAKIYVLNEIKQYLPNKIWLRYNSPNGTDYYENSREMTIIGIYIGSVNNGNYNYGFISNSLMSEFSDEIGGIYNFAIASLDYNNESRIRQIVEYTYAESDKIVYNLNNPVMSSMSEINNLIETLSKVFLYVGIGFAAFAALLLLNFITISISYKKREIGVLRAIGARGMDVFKIFFNEAFIIAFINFILASIGSIIVCSIINGVIRTQYGMLITILNMGVRQVVLMFAVSLGVAFLSSFLPVRSIARKKPIDAIRNS